jgi:hypothetical protein
MLLLHIMWLVYFMLRQKINSILKNKFYKG